VKALAGFIALFGIAMAINAAEGKWAFHRATSGAGYVVLDAVIAVGCFAWSYWLWRRAMHEELVAEYRAKRDER